MEERLQQCGHGGQTRVTSDPLHLTECWEGGRDGGHGVRGLGGGFGLWCTYWKPLSVETAVYTVEGEGGEQRLKGEREDGRGGEEGEGGRGWGRSDSWIVGEIHKLLKISQVLSQLTTLSNGGCKLSQVCPQVFVTEAHHYHLRQQLQCRLCQLASVTKPGVRGRCRVGLVGLPLAVAVTFGRL